MTVVNHVLKNFLPAVRQQQQTRHIDHASSAAQSGEAMTEESRSSREYQTSQPNISPLHRQMSAS
jgi:hypothetical protein